MEKTRDTREMFKELVAADIIGYGGGNGKDKFSFSAGVQYGETFAKCFSGVQTVDSYDELEDLYDKWKEYGWTGVVAWLSIKEGNLPLYWYVDHFRATGYGELFDSLGLPENPANDYYRDLAKKDEEWLEELRLNKEKENGSSSD